MKDLTIPLLCLVSLYLLFLTYSTTDTAEAPDMSRHTTQQGAQCIKDAKQLDYSRRGYFWTRLDNSVMMEPNGAQAVCTLLNHDRTVLEFGSGGSTLFFSKYAREWLSVEHDRRFFKAIGRKLKDRGMLRPKGNVIYVNNPEVALAQNTTRKFDIIINDARHRITLARIILQRQLLRPGGRMVVHDYERAAYKSMEGHGWRLIKLIDDERRHTAVLVPS